MGNRRVRPGGKPPAIKRIGAPPRHAPAPTGVPERFSVVVAPARQVAFALLLRIEAGKAHSDTALRAGAVEALREQDRHLVTTLVMGVLRWRIALDAVVRGLLQKPDESLPGPVALALRMGAFQLLHLDRIPAHAVLSDSVELVRQAGAERATGLVNAVLRKIAASKDLLRAKGLAKPLVERTDAMAVRMGHPAWLVERWVNEYGRAAAAKVCEADQVEPGRGALFALPAPEMGDADLPALPEMDDGSRLVAELAVAAVPPVQGRALQVWDCCAAPGGKTLVLAARLGARADLLATDVSGKRVAAMQARVREFRYAGELKTAVLDATKLPESAGNFDLILCDVPCSGTGTLGRNPEIRLFVTPEELARQAVRQRAILQAALGRLAPGGRLVYSTCSLEAEENEAVVASVATGFRRVPLETLLEQVPDLAVGRETLVRDGVLRTLPGVNPCDGFYAVVLERT